MSMTREQAQEWLEEHYWNVCNSWELVVEVWEDAYEQGRQDAAPQWIPCSEQMPESDDKEVLAWEIDFGALIAIWRDDEWYVWNWNVLESLEITHWMPLPEDPK